MLRRLELVGFKSFADKTLFEFSPGITALVGPNGSGKSNIVDAIRWVLGEQSAKSLRGQEMVDVIFNGSSSRRSLGLAEVTMVFDNAGRSLSINAEEVRITRRVYRGGEGEYLINQQPARLKDIKELFLGSGAGANAYCVLEQGGVDAVLQASAYDRRVVFEEAAGISRFKAKKLETQRKLERVDQNLQRLRDIFEEVEKQLRSVRLQATKAERFQEYQERLKQLRIGLGLQEFQELAEHIRAETAILDQLRADLQGNATQMEAWETELRLLEQTLAQLNDTFRTNENLRTEVRQRIAGEEATLAHERDLSADLDADVNRARAHAAEQAARIAALADSETKAAEELAAVKARCELERSNVQALQQQQEELAARLVALNEHIRADKAKHIEHMRQLARLHNDAVTHKSQIDNLDRERQRLCQRGEQAARHLAPLDVELHDLTAADETAQMNLTAVRQKLTDQRSEADRLRRLHEEKASDLANLRGRRSALASRIEVLEDIERSREGLGAGVREVLDLIAVENGSEKSESDNSPLATVPARALGHNILGLVADVLTVPHEHAALIDLALGETARCFLVRDPVLLDAVLSQRPKTFSSRVSFLSLERAEEKPDALRALLNAPEWADTVWSDPRVVAAADRLVSSADPMFSGLARQLLGRTLLVTDLAAARALAARSLGYRFVTAGGELLEADGTLTIGAHQPGTGLLSRKSELRELHEQVAYVDRGVDSAEHELVQLREQACTAEACSESLQREVELLSQNGADLRTRLEQFRRRREELHQELTLSGSEIRNLEGDLHDLQGSWNEIRVQAEGAQKQVEQLEIRLQEAEQEISRLEGCRQQLQQDATAASVALAQSEERLAAIRAKHQQISADLGQRIMERTETASQMLQLLARREASEHMMLRASSVLAAAYLDKEQAEHREVSLALERDEVSRQHARLTESTRAALGTWREQREHAHACELRLNDLHGRRVQLTERFRDDYQVDLAQLPQESFACNPQDTTEVNEEIANLRRKLTKLGSVNLEALRELAELEERAKTLQAQVDDLGGAQRSLEEIINKINADSRKLFAETLASIRVHFQELFRKLFGGGMADIVLQDETDLLESGIDIIARPPGKEQGNLSLMSGGEKTLTAVALLLAIFRSKPSPFCILDEVDAALDESNIGRFTAVLRDFLDRSQFILITHSKRTMSAADVLYGITMQESGVSRRVALRFEDWPDEGAPDSETPMRRAA